jgi:hypothetical protein
MAKQLFAHCQLEKNQQRCYEWIGIGRYVDSTRWFVDECVYLRCEEENNEHLDRIASEYLRGNKVLNNTARLTSAYVISIKSHSYSEIFLCVERYGVNFIELLDKRLGITLLLG